MSKVVVANDIHGQFASRSYLANVHEEVGVEVRPVVTGDVHDQFEQFVPYEVWELGVSSQEMFVEQRRQLRLLLR